MQNSIGEWPRLKKSNQLRRLGCQGLTEHEVLILQSMLRLFSGRGQTPWEVCEVEPFDALIVPDTRSELDEGGLYTRLFIRTNLHSKPTQGERRTHYDCIVRPIQLLPLLAKLNQIDHRLYAQEPVTITAQREWADVLIEYWENAGGFLVTTATTRIILFPQAHRFLSEHPDLSAAEIVCSPVLNIKPLESSHAEEILRQRRTNGLGWLGWSAGHFYPLPILLVSTPADVAVRLRRWPDFGRLDHLPEYLNLAKLLKRYSMTTAQLLEAANLPTEIVYRFLNASYLSGLLVETHEQGWRSRFKRRDHSHTSATQGVIGFVRHHLGL